MEKELINLNDEMIENMIYEIRGQKIMLDFELARIFGYETRRFNEQVQRNIDKKDLNLRFQLTKDDIDIISMIKNKSSMSQIATPILQESGMKGGRTKLPYAFTEQGIYTLLTVLKGEAVNINGKKIIDYFNNLKNAKIWPSEAKNLDIVKFESGGIILDVNVSPNEDTVWLTQNDMAILYDTTVPNISMHIANIYDSNELEKSSTLKKSLTVAANGKNYNMVYYNLDVVLIVGYRVNTKRSMEFRRWANNILKDYLIKGYSINTKRCLEHSDIIMRLVDDVNKLAKNMERLDSIENDIKILKENFLDPNTYKHYAIFNGNRIESDIAYQSIYKLAKSSIYIIDDYIDIKTFKLLKDINSNVNITIISDNKGTNKLDKIFIDDFIKDTNKNLIMKYNNKEFHSRYIVIDYGIDNWKLYFCGGSSKDGGTRINTIIEVEDKNIYIESISRALNNEILKIK